MEHLVPLNYLSYMHILGYVKFGEFLSLELDA